MCSVSLLFQNCSCQTIGLFFPCIGLCYISALFVNNMVFIYARSGLSNHNKNDAGITNRSSLVPSLWSLDP